MFRLSFSHLIGALVAIAFLLILFLNTANVEANYHNCLDTEDLKEARLEEGRERHKNLDRNGRLLNIVITDEVRKESKRILDRDEEKYAPDDCKRFYLPWEEN